MGLFDRFKKKAEELYNDVTSSIQGFMNRNEKVEAVSTIPTAPIDTGTNTTTTAIKETIKEIKPKVIEPEVPKFIAPVVDKNAHLTFFKDEAYLSSLDSLKHLMKSKDLSELESERSQQTIQIIKGTLYSLDDKTSFVNDVEYNVKKDELRDIVKAFSNKIQTMRFEHESLDQLERASMHLGAKDSRSPDEGTLMHRIKSWSQIKERVDRYGNDYDFQSDKVKNAVLGFKEDVKNNPYITCSKLMDGETITNRLDLDNLSTLRNLKNEFSQHNTNGPTFKKMLEGIKAYKDFEKLDDSFKTPRMQETADNFRAKAEVFCKIAESLQKTGNIPALDKGLDLVSAFEKQVAEFDKKHPRVNNEGPSRQKSTIS